MPNYRPRQELRDGIIQAFSARDEVFRVTLFGKEAVGRQDAFSDIDLIVYSNDPVRTWLDYRQVFASVSPIVGTFSLGGGPGWFAETLIVSGFSPYHKIDFSIGHGLDPALITEQVVYECPQKGVAPVSHLVVEEGPRDTSFRLADQLFAVPRFLKCIFRQDIDLYRRWTGNLNAVLVLWYEKMFGWQVETRKTKLLSYEVDQLMGVLPAAERVRLHAVCPPDGNVNIARSYRNGIDACIQLSREKAAVLGEKLNEPLIDYLKAFLEEEYQRLKLE